MSSAPRPARSLSLLQATQEAPSLAHLVHLSAQSSLRLEAVTALIPQALRPAVQAGPLEGDGWCLLVRGNAAAAKVRQLLPAMQACLRQRGLEVSAIRLKVQAPKTPHRADP